MANISIDNLASEIMKCMADYSDEVAERTKIAVDRTVEGSLEEVKSHTEFNDISGDYREALGTDVAYEDRFNKRVAVHARGNQCHLTHLLEYGHDFPKEHFPNAKGRARAFPHFKFGKKYAEENLEKNIIEELDK